MNGSPLPDQADIALLDALQDDIPLVPRPWKAIAGRLGMAEDDLLVRVKRLHDAGIIRGISPVLDSRSMGLHAATLVALQVPEERLQETAAIISSFPEVSHNFRRDHPYPLWFTISAGSEERIRQVLARILHRAGIPDEDVLNLPTVRKFKADVRFSFGPCRDEEGRHGPG